MASSLQSRLATLSASHKQVLPLISRLQTLTVAVGQGDDARVELGGEIHGRLKEMEEEMELLRVEVDGLESGASRRRDHEDKEAEKERIISSSSRVERDLKSTRAQFRKAQLQAKRNAELAKRKERELLLSGAREGNNSSRQENGKLTHDDLVMNASSDVTSALRRTHQLMQAELSRSQFAQETLEQSTAALSSLSESYSNLDTLLSSSRSLVGSLLRSQKSDTWYLETAFYILIGTIAWLLFRRILYGPMWWLLWVPIKLVYRVTFSALGIVGLSGAAVQSTSAAVETASTSLITQRSASAEFPQIPTMRPDRHVVVGGGGRGSGWGQDRTPPHQPESVVEHIERIVNDGETQDRDGKDDVPEQGTNVDDISPEEKERQEQLPKNTKKRMWEEEVEAEKQRTKDEL